MVVCEMEVRILGKRSGAKSRRNMKTGGRRSWKAKGSEGNGRVGTKRRKGETEVEPRIRTDRVFARSVFYIYRAGGKREHVPCRELLLKCGLFTSRYFHGCLM